METIGNENENGKKIQERMENLKLKIGEQEGLLKEAYEELKKKDDILNKNKRN